MTPGPEPDATPPIDVAALRRHILGAPDSPRAGVVHDTAYESHRLRIVHGRVDHVDEYDDLSGWPKRLLQLWVWAALLAAPVGLAVVLWTTRGDGDPDSFPPAQITQVTPAP